MNIIESNYGIQVNGNFISFEGNTHDTFLLLFTTICNSVQNPDKEFLEKASQVITTVKTLKANQRPLTEYPQYRASDYYNRFVAGGNAVVPGSVDDTIVVPKGTRRK